MVRGAPYFVLGAQLENSKTPTNMDIVWDDDPDVIDMAMILFTEGGDFSLENEVLHLIRTTTTKQMNERNEH